MSEGGYKPPDRSSVDLKSHRINVLHVGKSTEVVQGCSRIRHVLALSRLAISDILPHAQGGQQSESREMRVTCKGA